VSKQAELAACALELQEGMAALHAADIHGQHPSSAALFTAGDCLSAARATHARQARLEQQGTEQEREAAQVCVCVCYKQRCGTCRIERIAQP
jgi:uncharacterized protein with PIN domain